MSQTRTIGAALALAALLAAGLAPEARADESDLWLLVEVDEAGGAQVRVNLPLRLVQTVVAAIPEAKLQGSASLGLDPGEISVEDLRAIWAELERSPDATYVTVDEPNSRVRVSKRAGMLLVEVTDTGERSSEVVARLPLSVAEGLLAGDEPHLDLRAAVQALIDSGEGELVTVTDGDDRVRVRIGRPGS